ncbi:kinase-like protein [Hymenopellis radicata]|nr:kinase-like protein [Hymenopellis radicata]
MTKTLSNFTEYDMPGALHYFLNTYGALGDSYLARAYLWDIVNGLRYLHDTMNIIHRDLCSDNIFLEDGRCVIGGFGLHSGLGIEKATKCSITPAACSVFWMAPEMMNCSLGDLVVMYDTRVDIWSLGCLAYEMWTGESLWASSVSIAASVVDFLADRARALETPPPPEGMNLSYDAESFRQCCLAFTPERRASAAQLQNHAYLVMDGAERLCDTNKSRESGVVVKAELI